MSARRFVLVPCEGSEASKSALSAARRIAKTTGAEIALLHVLQDHEVSDEDLRRKLRMSEAHHRSQYRAPAHFAGMCCK
ncbi:MAG: universal stress protein [Acidobacteriaceae bacterium]|nr:universal stress protein [Acidobacteriaceae bacterium]